MYPLMPFSVKKNILIIILKAGLFIILVLILVILTSNYEIMEGGQWKALCKEASQS